MIRKYKLEIEGEKIRYLLLPDGALLENALKLMGIDKAKVKITLEAIS